MSDNDIVIRTIDPSLTVISSPFKRSGLPIGGRSTVITLSLGTLLIVASTPLTPKTKDKITELGGVVSYLVSLDHAHFLFLKQWKEAYPSARVIGVEGTEQKLKEVTFDALFGVDARPFGAEITEAELSHEYFSGFVNKDVALLHHPTRTLITADLLWNLPATEAFSKSSSSSLAFLTKYFRPGSALHKSFVHRLGAKDKKQMMKSAEVVRGWDFDRVIPAHGDVVETEGKKAWDATYTQYYRDADKTKGKP